MIMIYYFFTLFLIMTIMFFIALHKIIIMDFLLKDIKIRVSAIDTAINISDQTAIKLILSQIIEDIENKEVFFKNVVK